MNNYFEIRIEKNKARKLIFFLFIGLALIISIIIFINLLSSRELNSDSENIASEDTIHFEDEDFAEIFSRSIGLRNSSNIPIRVIENTETLTLNGNGEVIGSIDDLAMFDNLEELEIINLNFEETFDLSQLENLTVLRIAYMPVDNFEGIENTNLEELHLNYNDMQELDDEVTQIDSLEILNLNNNSLQNVDHVFDLNSILELHISNNLVETVDVEDYNNSLLLLDLSINPVASMQSVDRLASLEELILSYTELNNLNNIASFPELTSLDLTGTEVELDELSSSESLEAVYLEDTEISEIDKTYIAEIPNLNSIYLDPDVDREFLDFLINDFYNADPVTRAYLVAQKYGLE